VSFKESRKPGFRHGWSIRRDWRFAGRELANHDEQHKSNSDYHAEDEVFIELLVGDFC
jgi:hypothetical protein